MGNDLNVSASQRNPFVSRQAKFLDERLWGGFSAAAARALNSLRLGRSEPIGERVGAAWALARWHARRGDPKFALQMFRFMHQIAGSPIVTDFVALLESECLIDIGEMLEARRVLERSLRASSDFRADLWIASANTFAFDGSADATRLEWISRLLVDSGFAPLAKARAGEPLTIDNLAAPAATRLSDRRYPKVSVIVPVYNSADTITTALTSIANQTWPHVEVIVVDDCSNDGTWETVKGFAQGHSNIVTLRQESNQGAFRARNRGLWASTGDLITAHDADDWSHPQKIEFQALAFARDRRLVGVRSHWVRATGDLRLVNVAMTKEEYLIKPNYSSFMFSRRMLNRSGEWDDVRSTANSEFITRAKRIFGDTAFSDIFPGVPLAFGRVSDASLTGSTETHANTHGFGIRRNYRDAYLWWHDRTEDVSQLRLQPGSSPRPFPAPHRLLPDRPSPPLYEVLVLADSRVDGEPMSSTLAFILAHVEARKRIAFFHWPHFDGHLSINPQIWRMAQDGQLDVVCAGEQVSAKAVLIGDLTIMQCMLDRPPTISAERVYANPSTPVGEASLRGLFDPSGPMHAAILTIFGRTVEPRPMIELMESLPHARSAATAAVRATRRNSFESRTAAGAMHPAVRVKPNRGGRPLRDHRR